MSTRRRFLSLTASIVPIGIAGCMEDDKNNGETGPKETPLNEDGMDVENPQPVSDEEFAQWEPKTQCSSGDPAVMLDSEISVQTVKDEISDKYKPIKYDSLSRPQKEILATVLTVGGYSTCSESDEFSDFLITAIQRTQNQDGEDSSVYLEYDNKYYRLYLRRSDQVYTF